MASLPVMLFLIILLLPSMLIEGRVSIKWAVTSDLPDNFTQNEFSTSADHRTDPKAALDKTDCQGEVHNIEKLEKMLCASHQDQLLSEDLANANQHKLNLCKTLTTLSECFTQKQQEDSVIFKRKGTRIPRSRIRPQKDNIEDNLIYILLRPLKEFIDICFSNIFI
ncbi:exocrine gland-secreted peptide 1-like [Acomys russatus]|uniref:exocrine gland-secreted peptide 1-like n=1 Tax=Acomys russatus TaxID=60746 RepID=UPI0021E1D4BD|nr:exocrine gland-secreted peptide 1-like [Acomys russatus]